VTVHGAAFEFAARRKALRQAFVPGWALLACLLVLTQAPTGLRAPVVIVFFCFVPGTALVGLFNPDSFGVELSLSVALSVAVSGLTAGVLVYAHLWSPTAVVLIVTAISLVAALRDFELDRSRARTRPRGRPRPMAREVPAAVRQPAGLASPRRRTARGSRPEGTAGAPIAVSPLQGFLLDELRRRTGSAADSPRWRRPPRSLADLEPHELAELLSWSSLQRFVMQRAIREVKPELWFVDDLERRLWSQSPDELRRHTPSAPRGVWITGASARASIPVGWRVLEDEGKKDWRTRLALELIDALPAPHPAPHPDGAVVAADTTYGSLSGFRRALMSRGLWYLMRVDPVTAARELAPDRPGRTAAEARDFLRERIAAQPHMHAVRDEPDLVRLQGAEQLLICEVPAAGGDGAFWLSNLPARTVSERLASLLRLANRCRVERTTPDLLEEALKMAVEDGAGLDRELTLLALALTGDLHKPDVSTGEGDEN
jgi:hypothetical protein